MFDQNFATTETFLHLHIQSQSQYKPFDGTRMKRQAGKRQSTVHTLSSIFNPFQKPSTMTKATNILSTE